MEVLPSGWKATPQYPQGPGPSETGWKASWRGSLLCSLQTVAQGALGLLGVPVGPERNVGEGR